MSNLAIENLSKIVQTGDTEALFGQSPAMREAKVTQEMQANGMSVSPSGGSGEVQGFAKMLTESMEKVNLDQVQADRAVKELVAGRSKNIHETMLAVERADTSLKLMMQVRNKVLDAYREIMRMQV